MGVSSAVALRDRVGGNGWVVTAVRTVMRETGRGGWAWAREERVRRRRSRRGVGKCSRVGKRRTRRWVGW